jgi:hypothetical protein
MISGDNAASHRRSIAGHHEDSRADPLSLRAAFLHALADELGDRDGDGEVHRAAVRARQSILPRLQGRVGPVNWIREAG